MGLRLIVLSVVLTASLWSQRKFSWQDACFKNPGAPYCQGRDYAVKRKPPAQAPRDVVTNPGASIPRNPTPSVIVVGGLDWRFADPSADALIGINSSALAASPIARNLIVQLGATRGLSEKDVQKIVDGLSGAGQVAVSIRDNRIVALVTGGATDAALVTPEAGSKVAPISGGAMLVGHPDAVDQAAQRIAMNAPVSELAHSAEERRSKSDFWAIASPRSVGSPALSEGVKRFYLTVSFRNGLASDVALEFDGTPNDGAIRVWQTALAAATIEGNIAHLITSLETDDARQKFVASPLGQRLAVLVQAAGYLPARETTTLPKRAKPVIYGLDGGPKEVN